MTIAERNCRPRLRGAFHFDQITAAQARQIIAHGGVMPATVNPEIVLDIEAGGPPVREGGFPFRGRL